MMLWTVLCLFFKSVSMNSAMTQIDISGHTKESVESLVSKIGYVNPRVKMTPESSHLTFKTAVRWRIVFI